MKVVFQPLFIRGHSLVFGGPMTPPWFRFGLSAWLWNPFIEATVDGSEIRLTSWCSRYPSCVVVSNIFYFHPYLGKIAILSNIFQRGWNHQPASIHRSLYIPGVWDFWTINSISPFIMIGSGPTLYLFLFGRGESVTRLGPVVIFGKNEGWRTT